MKRFACLALLLMTGCARPTTTTTQITQARPTAAPMQPVSVHIPAQPVISAQPTPLPVPSVDFGGDVAGVVKTAQSWLGVPYLWGGCTKNGVDCSCAVRNWWAPFGANLPRVTTQQWAATARVSRDELQPLDLVFFADTCTGCGPNPTHVGLYLGNGMMIQAGGDTVSIQPVFSGFYGAHYMGAGRVQT